MSDNAMDSSQQNSLARQPMADKRLTHVDTNGEAHMVDVGDKEITQRQAIAQSTIVMKRTTLDLIESGGATKGNVLNAARIAGIMAAKRTSELIPLCHPLHITKISVEPTPVRDDNSASIVVTATVRALDQTGVEMEALVAATVAALTIYDMCKAVDREMVITETYLVEKTGGKSGRFVHPNHSGDVKVL